MLVDYLTQLTEARCIESAWQLHVAKMQSYGFDKLLYGFTRFRTENSLGDPDDFLILSNHKSKYIDRFIGERLYLHAPMVRWSVANDGACSWDWIDQQLAEGKFGREELKVIEFNRMMGVVAGYSISFISGSQRAKAAMALTSRPGMTQLETNQIWAEHGRDILVMCNVAHLKLGTLPYVGYRPALTHRQREALEWVGDGKTTQEIACIMGLTSATIEKHLRLARQALQVDTTAQAVLKASFSNQIYHLNT